MNAAASLSNLLAARLSGTVSGDAVDAKITELAARFGVTLAHCPGCNAEVAVELHDSLNWGNVVAMCYPADHEFDYTEIDHAGILREARKGF